MRSQIRNSSSISYTYVCVYVKDNKTDVSDFVYFSYRLFLNHIMHHVTYATYHEPVTSRGVLRLFLNRMLHHVTSPAKNPLTPYTIASHRSVGANTPQR